MRSFYQRLLRLYPAVYRQEFGEEMQCVFLQAQAERSIAPLMKRAKFCARELMGLFSGAVQAQREAQGGAQSRGGRGGGGGAEVRARRARRGDDEETAVALVVIATKAPAQRQHHAAAQQRATLILKSCP